MGSWEVEEWERQDEIERQALMLRCAAHAFAIEAGGRFTVHDPIVFPDRTLLRVTGPDGEYWYESGGRCYANVRGQRPEWRAYLAAVEKTTNELLEEEDLWPGTADPNHPAWDG